MKRGYDMMGFAALLGLLASGIAMPVLAQNGGGGGNTGGGGGGGNTGGGANARHGGKYNIIWDAAQPISGRTPRAIGAVNVSTYVTTINLDVRLIGVNLPDNTPLTVTAYAMDYFTGLPWFSQNAGTIYLNGQGGSLLVPGLWVTAPGYLPIVTGVVVTQADGTVVISGHP